MEVLADEIVLREMIPSGTRVVRVVIEVGAFLATV